MPSVVYASDPVGIGNGVGCDVGEQRTGLATDDLVAEHARQLGHPAPQRPFARRIHQEEDHRERAVAVGMDHVRPDRALSGCDVELDAGRPPTLAFCPFRS